MRVLLVGDHETSTLQVRQILLQEGQECPPGHIVSLDQAMNRVTQVNPDLVVVVVAADPDHTVTALSELRLLTKARLLGVGPATDSKFVLRALRAGADDYVDENELEVELKSALERLRIENPIHGEVGRMIAVLAPSGGSGSSTLAVNVATVLAGAHKKCALFDLRFATGDLAPLLDLKPAHTLADLCQNLARLDQVLFEKVFTLHSSGVHLLASPRSRADIGQITLPGVRQALAMARASFPYVVADVDHSFSAEQREALRQADVILLVFRLDFTSLRNMQRTLEYLEQIGIARERVRLVVNRYGQPNEVPSARAEEALGLPISHYIPDDSKSVNLANNKGVPVVLGKPSARVSRSLIQMAASVNGQSGKR